MKKIMARLLLFFLLLTVLTVFAPPVAFAEETEPCEHVWDDGVVTKEATCTQTGVKTYTCTLCGETQTETLPKTEHIEGIEIVKEATAKTRGELYIKCSSCGSYKRVSGSSVSWLLASKKATVYYYYKPYTLIYRSLDGTETQVGTFRGVSITNDYYGSEGLVEKFPEMPYADKAPVGYRISEFEANRYAVLKDGVPKYSFTPGNNARVVSYSWLNDTDYTYYIVSLFAISVPEVSITQDGAVLTAQVANWNENLSYTYQWYRNGEAIEGAAEKTYTITEKCTDESAKYTVEVSVTSAEDSTIPTLNPTHSETATSAVLDTKLPHAWDEGTVTKEPSCTATGTKTYTCTNEGCTETKTETLPKTEHIEGIEIVKEATAKTRGELYIKCSSCGSYKRVSGSSVSWLLASKKATVYYYYKPYTLIYRSLDGTETQVGTFRGVSITNDYYGSEGLVEKFPEMPYADKAPVGYRISEFEANRYAVLKDGVPKYSFTPGNNARVVSYSWLNSTDYTYTIVSLFAISVPEVSITQDGAVLTAQVANWNENLAYTYQWYKNGEPIEGATERTCIITEKCTEASAKYSVTVSVTSAEDSTIPTLNPTHSESATAECTPEIVHTPVEIPGAAATCTEDGLTAGSKCSTCGEILVEQEVIPAAGHTVVTDPAVPATCEETGLTEGSHCSVCGLVIKAQTSIPALGHKYGAWKDSKDGKTHIRVCANDPTHILSQNHTYGEWTVTKEATATEKGSKERECSVCGYKQTVSIPALDPIPKTGDETNAPVYVLLAVVSLMSLACLSVVIKKKA